MKEQYTTEAFSDIDPLHTVIIHEPGKEIENMVPENTERALYSDLLNLSIAKKEYAEFKAILEKFCNTIEIKNLLTSILYQTNTKKKLLTEICENENASYLLAKLSKQTPEELAEILIEGQIMEKNNLTRFLDNNRYALHPLHNFFFIRDTAIAIGNQVVISQMANKVRARESTLLEYIFTHHPQLKNTKHFSIPNLPGHYIEGGDIIPAFDNILIIGMGERSSSSGIDYLIEKLDIKDKPEYHIIVQELPRKRESFIHLDMVFTFIDKETCMVYPPLFLQANNYQTIHIQLKFGKVEHIKKTESLPKKLEELGKKIRYIKCGGEKEWNQEREQWHSGANFLALAPGKIIGYARNTHTLESLNNAGYEIATSQEILTGKKNSSNYPLMAITIPGSELARGGGGPRCMSLPISRNNTNLTKT